MRQRTVLPKRVSPIIIAVRDHRDIAEALAQPHQTLFLLSTSLNTVAGVVDRVRRAGKDAFVHFDLVEGLAKDTHALRWLAETARPTGIMTTRAPIVGQAKSLGLVAIQRIFLLDSQSVQTGLALCKDVKPDFLEVMPGVVPDTIRHLAALVPCPIIAGGLCTTVSHFTAAREAGAVAVSTSERSLWHYSGDLASAVPARIGGEASGR